jgi:hypothetical protein
MVYSGMASGRAECSRPEDSRTGQYLRDEQNPDRQLELIGR